MLFAAGAASSAIDILKSLTSPASASPVKAGIDFDAVASASATTSPIGAAPSGSSGTSALSPDTFNALLAAQGQATSSTAPPPPSRQDALKGLFASLDGDGDGKITKSEFETALGAGGTNVAKADEVFGKLDSNGDGSVSLDELGGALKSGKGHHHHAHNAQNASQEPQQADPLLQSLDGASSTTSANSDGSTTTTLTYADGSRVSMSTSAASSSYNFVEQAIAKQAQALATSAKGALSVSV